MKSALVTILVIMSATVIVEAEPNSFLTGLKIKAVDSCVGRCGIAGTDPTKPCQCNPSCLTYNDCCVDFLPTCNTCAGRCTAGYDTKWPCQCNNLCESNSNCCPDYPYYCLGVTTSTTTMPTTKPPFTCPNGLTAVYPNPDDCHTYYECVAEVAYLRECPPGLYFNPDLSVCDYLDNVPSCQ